MEASQATVTVRYLHPGQWYVGSGDQRVYTVLGSCVAVVLWHEHRQVGAMCHYMLPGTSTRGFRDGRYAEDALVLVAGALRRHGCDPVDCRVELYGGGYHDPAHRGGPLSNPGARNVEQAWRLTERHGLAVAAYHLGGHLYRRVGLNLKDGQTHVLCHPWTDAAAGQ